MMPLCFVLMPFGKKPTNDGRLVDFDNVYETIIKPAIVKAEMEPLRADEEITGGIIHKAMFERLILCEYAIADLTTANANVFYELGVRHSIRQWATQLIFADGWGQLPFDVNLLRALPYKLGAGGRTIDPSTDVTNLVTKLKIAKQANTDSPLFQLLDGYPDIARLKTDVFRDQIKYAESIKSKLAGARKQNDAASIFKIENDLGDISVVDAAIVVDLFLSYRSVKSWKSMIELVKRMSKPLASTVLVQEQLGLALNRNGQSDEAEKVLLRLISERGGSSETYGILGRIYKDRWEVANNCGDIYCAKGLIEKAISAYLDGFEADWRDCYPGINAATLMEIKDPPDSRQSLLLPVLRYSNERRIVKGRPDYWDFATQLEISILSKDEKTGKNALFNSLANIREIWEPETTARNLSFIREARAKRGLVLKWADIAEEELIKRTKV